MANKAGGRPETRAVKQAKRIALPTIEGLKTISPKKLYKLSCSPPPKNIVDSIEKELNWGADKLRDDITCMAINIEKTDLIKKKN